MDGGADARRITIHAPEDFAGMRVAGQLAAATLDMITPHVRPGVTTARSTSCAMPSSPGTERSPRR